MNVPVVKIGDVKGYKWVTVEGRVLWVKNLGRSQVGVIGDETGLSMFVAGRAIAFEEGKSYRFENVLVKKRGLVVTKVSRIVEIDREIQVKRVRIVGVLTKILPDRVILDDGKRVYCAILPYPEDLTPCTYYEVEGYGSGNLVVVEFIRRYKAWQPLGFLHLK